MPYNKFDPLVKLGSGKHTLATYAKSRKSKVAEDSEFHEIEYL